MTRILAPSPADSSAPAQLPEPETAAPRKRTFKEWWRDTEYAVENAITRYVNTHFAPVWWVIQHVAFLERFFNRLLVNNGVAKLPPRPYALSTKQDFTSWESLMDKTF